MGEAAAYLISHQAEGNTDQLDNVSTFLEDSELEQTQDDETPEFDEWICNLLDNFDTVQSTSTTFYIKFSIPELQDALLEMLNSIFSVIKHLLVDTGAPKSIRSDQWMKEANWTPQKLITLQDHIRPFRFAGHPVHALHPACLISIIRDLKGNPYYLRFVTFILPPTPIPFLFGLQDQRRLGFDLCLRENNGSHLKITTWNALSPLVVNSHIWLGFEPCNKDPNPNFDWTPLINKAIDTHTYETDFNIVFSCTSPTLSDALSQEDSPSGVLSPWNTSIVAQTTSKSAQTTSKPSPPLSIEDATTPVIDITASSQPHSDTFPVPPWEKDSWQSNTTEKNIRHLHNCLRHPEPSALLQFCRQQRAERKLPPVLRDSITSLEFKACAENPQLPRIPKLALPYPATPNIAVSLDTMHHIIRGAKISILVMFDQGDSLLRLKHLPDESARTAFNAFFSRWISIFDAPVYTIVDRGWNLTNKLMADELRILNSQFCPIPTEAPWSIGSNERSHKFLLKAIGRLTHDQIFDCGPNYERLLGEIEMAWNFCQHSNRIIPHYYRFGTKPRMLGELSEPQTLQQRIALMEICPEQTEQMRADNVIRSAANSARRHVLRLILFTVHQKVWFYRKRDGWRLGTVTRIDRPTIFATHKHTVYPTHEHRVRPFFGELSMPPDLLNYDPAIHELIEKPYPSENIRTEALPLTKKIAVKPRLQK